MVDETSISMRDMLEQKSVSYEVLIFLEILDTARALTDGGERAFNAVMSFRPLLVIQADDIYSIQWKEHLTAIQAIKKKYVQSWDYPDKRQQAYAEMQPVLMDEYESLIALAKRRGLIKTGRGVVEKVGITTESAEETPED